MKAPSFLRTLSAAASLLAATLPTTAALPATPDDEPDSLSWEFFSQDRDIILHFLDWAATNPPPPGSTGSLPVAAAQERAPSAARFPFVWIKPAQLPFEEAPGWCVDKWSGRECLYGVRYKAKRTWQTIEVPCDGTYRFWIYQAHTKGFSESNFFTLAPAFDEEHPADAPADPVFNLLSQTFCRANGFRGGIHYSRPNDPAPQINDMPTPPGGFLWEPTHKTAFLKKGRYTVSFAPGVVTTPRSSLCIADYVLVGDPLFSPEGLSMDVSTNGFWETPEATRSPLYAIRPGAGLAEGVEPSPALLDWWKAWREALYDKLAAEEHGTNYLWGGFASRVAFDEETDAVDRPTRLRALRRAVAQPADYYSAFADEFARDARWVSETGYFHRVHTARAIRAEGRDYGTASNDFEIATGGTYHLWTEHYLAFMPAKFCRGAMRVDVSANGEKVASYIIGAGDGSVLPCDGSWTNGVTAFPRSVTHGDNACRPNQWCDSGAIELPAGRVSVSVTSVAPPWATEELSRPWRRIFCRAVLVRRDDFNPDLPHEYPAGDRVGDGPIGFWRSPDPWAGVGRYSPVATARHEWKLTPRGTDVQVYSWEPVPADEVNRPRHAVKAARGETLSELLIVRNNTAGTIWVEPETGGDLPVRCRLVAWGPTPDGSHTPRFLLARRRIALPPFQNTLLWVNIDCAGGAEGRHSATLTFGGLSHAWDVDVAGSIEETPPPLAYPWSAPFGRESCWELYRELGFNVVSVRGPAMRFLSKKAADRFGMRLFRLDGDTNTVAAVAADWRRRGFDDRDFCFLISDEPGFGAMTNWVARAKAFKAIDPKVRIWCNTGFFPTEAQWDDCREFMSLWDVFCPFRNAFVEGYRPPVDPERMKLYRQIGSPKLGYITPSKSIYWLLDGGHEIFQFSRQCRETGRDGWSSVRFQTETSWELAHPEQQPIFSGAWGRTLSTRYAETAREANQRWRKADAGIAEKPAAVPEAAAPATGVDAADGKVGAE